MQLYPRLHIKQAILSLAVSSSLILIPSLAHATDTVPNSSIAQAATDSASSQQSGMMMHHHQKMMQMLGKLHLSDDQWAKIKALDSTYPVSSSSSHKNWKAHHRAVMAILTPEQREKLRSLMKMEKNKGTMSPSNTMDSH